MALVVEDGTGVAGANTYVSLADARAYAADRGVTLPADDLTTSALLIKGMDYIEGFRQSYQGGKTYTGIVGYYNCDFFYIPLPADIDTHVAQSLQWPRVGVTVDEVPIDGNTIPRILVSAQCQCAMEIFSGSDLQANRGGQIVKIEKVDVIETEYMTASEMGSAVGMAVVYTKVDALLLPLFKSGGLFSTVRV